MSLSLKVARVRAGGRRMPGVGDPGFFDFIGGAIKKVASVAKAIPGPIGWAAAAASKVTQMLGPRAQPGLLPSTVPWGGGRQLGVDQTGALIPSSEMFNGPQLPPGPPLQQFGAPPAIGAPSGYHVNKTAYFLKDGTYVPEGSRWVKNRHRNPLNPRAASRAIGRLESLKRATARFGRITIRKPCCKHNHRKAKE